MCHYFFRVLHLYYKSIIITLSVVCVNDTLSDFLKLKQKKLDNPLIFSYNKYVFYHRILEMEVII